MAHKRGSRPDSGLGFQVKAFEVVPSWLGSGTNFYLTEIVHKVVSEKSTPAQIRQLIPHVSNNKECVDRLVRELTFANRLYKTLCEINLGHRHSRREQALSCLHLTKCKN